MKILVFGKGGREHALCWKIARSPKVTEILCVPGNPGISKEPKTKIYQNSNDNLNDPQTWIKIAKQFHPDLVVIGPESFLADGITDILEARGFPVFGPSQNASRLETSKNFCKQLLIKNNIPTAPAQIFTDSLQAIDYLAKIQPPYVIKADGLAQGKGVTVTDNLKQAQEAILDCINKKIFGSSGNTILIEEFLAGEECSIMAFTDGATIKTMPASQDHKRLLDNDFGPNTGGMGAYAPYPKITEKDLRHIENTILYPTIHGFKKEGIIYKGILFAGLMLTQKGPYVLEYNARFGDPEILPILMLLETDIVDIILACTQTRLHEIEISWDSAYSVAVEMVHPGYPQLTKPEISLPNLADINEDRNVKIFHAGTQEINGKLLTAGGRILAPTAKATTLQEAINKTYRAVSQIHWDNCYYRRDIGQKGV